MAQVALGIDCGTSGIRIAAVTRGGVLVSLASASILAPITSGTRHQQDPVLWWKALHEAFAKLDIKDHQPIALAIDGTSGTILSVDATGNSIGLASMYNDIAETSDVEKIAAVAPLETAARGGTSPLARALPLQKGAAHILHQADWLMGKFCGHFDISDENNALKTGYDPVARCWPPWIAATGLDVKLLPRVVPVGTRIGTITTEVAALFNLPNDLAIVSGTTDGCAAFLASGACRVGDGVTSLGTTLTLKLLSAKPIFAPRYGIYSHRIGDQWLAGGASNSGGGVLHKFFSNEQIAVLTQQLQPDSSTGLDYYPLSEVGERFPIADACLEPRLTPRPEKDLIFYQAILEGIASVEALGYQRLRELGASPLISMRSLGGGAGNTAWTQIRLKKLGVPALPALSGHAAVGTALLAWRGLSYAD
jgi:D-ribulokinase